MKWEKAPETLKHLLEEAMKDVDCEKRPMFGYPAYFINRNMFIGLFQSTLFIRLSPEQVVALRNRFGKVTNLEPMPGRPMKDYFVVPGELQADGKALADLIRDSAQYARDLKPKAKKPARKGAS